jgi:hypothetical protein
MKTKIPHYLDEAYAALHLHRLPSRVYVVNGNLSIYRRGELLAYFQPPDGEIASIPE